MTSTGRGLLALVIIAVLIVIGLVFFVRKPATSPSTDGSQPGATTVTYSCNGGKTIAAVFTQGESKPAASPDQPPTPGGSVALTLSDGRSMTLPQTISADGVRYANADESFVFWSKGNGALVLENNQQKSYIGCIQVAPEPVGASLPQVYSNSGDGFSIRLPEGYKTDEKYAYNGLGPGKDISGVKFTIPESMATGTNLGADSYVSVEEIPNAKSCSAAQFIYPGITVSTTTDNGITYSFASSTDAAAGNRYEEMVYAIPGTNPCMAVRYLIHYAVFENYPAGTVKKFDQQALLSQFDAIRRTLTVVQGAR